MASRRSQTVRLLADLLQAAPAVVMLQGFEETVPANAERSVVVSFLPLRHTDDRPCRTVSKVLVETATAASPYGE
jgi:hypothetical protein